VGGHPVAGSTVVQEVGMKAEFSAFSYSVAVLDEVSSTLGLDLATLLFLPSLGSAPAEGIFPALGWPVFLHFRLAEYMLTPRATGWAEHEERFFRLAIPPQSSSERHDLLRRLSEVEPEVYYVAPAFYRQREFARALAAGQVLENSRFIPVKSLPNAVQSRTLYVTYGRDKLGLRCFVAEEEGLQLDVAVDAGGWLAHVQGLLSKPRQLGWRFGLDLRENLLRCLQDATQQRRLFDELRVDLDAVIPSVVLGDLRYLLRGHFGLQALIMHSP
jgi:hypothetical protein